MQKVTRRDEKGRPHIDIKAVILKDEDGYILEDRNCFYIYEDVNYDDCVPCNDILEEIRNGFCAEIEFLKEEYDFKIATVKL